MLGEEVLGGRGERCNKKLDASFARFETFEREKKNDSPPEQVSRLLSCWERYIVNC